MPRTYLIRYLDAKTGFLQHEEFDTHAEMIQRILQLTRMGAKEIRQMPLVRAPGGRG